MRRWTDNPSTSAAFFRPGAAGVLPCWGRRTRRAALFFAILLIAAAARLGVIVVSRRWRLLGDNNNNNDDDAILPLHRTTSIHKVHNQEEDKSDPRCARAIDSLVHEQIRLVAFDFDMTLVDIHTGGRWRGSASALQPQVRPEMTCLVRACHRHGIHVAIATFSTQTDLVRTVVQNSLLPHYYGDSSSTTSRVVPVYGGNDRVAPYWHGKQSQLVLARQYFDVLQRNDGALALSPHEVVLVDDDERNIATAQADEYRTIWYNPERSDAEDALVLTKATTHL